MSEITKKRKRESTIIHGRPQKFFQGERRHFVCHFQIADDQCSLKDNFTLNKYLC